MLFQWRISQGDNLSIIINENIPTSIFLVYSSPTDQISGYLRFEIRSIDIRHICVNTIALPYDIVLPTVNLIIPITVHNVGTIGMRIGSSVGKTNSRISII